MPNRLSRETSPYLLQHAHNPVDWYPWGEEALERSKAEDKPILLSVGYSACHWCHVMERESFENAAIAAIMNEHFVCVKVDREERPDVDRLYMNAVQMMTGHGGWPMTVFLTPDRVPFYAGTYFPPTDRYGRPGFPRLLRGLADYYRTRRDDVAGDAAQVLAGLNRMEALPGDGPGEPTEAGLVEAGRKLLRSADATFGGFGGAPKFPGAMSLMLLLRAARRSGDEAMTAHVRLSLDHMARGGMYDQIGGGFHRYSVDREWLVPHFEKMLYDNALLARLYLEGFQATGDPFYAQIAAEICAYVQREMTSPEGGFYAAQDADSEGEEGRFYIWTPTDIRDVLGETDGDLFCRTFDITESGNFEGRNIPHLAMPLEGYARPLGHDEAAFVSRIAHSKRALYAERERRVKPGRDEKILTGWNGLMITAMAEVGAALERPEFVEAARSAASFILSRLRDEKGRLLRSFKDGQAKIGGFLEDYAALLEGVLALLSATGEPIWLTEAEQIADAIQANFWSGDRFHDTAHDAEPLLTRGGELYDNATPSGTSLAIFGLLKLAALTDRTEPRTVAETALARLWPTAASLPNGFGYLLSAADFAVGPVDEIVLVGAPNEPATSALQREVYARFHPTKLVLPVHPTERVLSPLAVRKTTMEGMATAYVCRDGACQQPVTTATDLRDQLAPLGVAAIRSRDAG